MEVLTPVGNAVQHGLITCRAANSRELRSPDPRGAFAVTPAPSSDAEGSSFQLVARQGARDAGSVPAGAARRGRGYLPPVPAPTKVSTLPPELPDRASRAFEDK